MIWCGYICDLNVIQTNNLFIIINIVLFYCKEFALIKISCLNFEDYLTW